MVGDDMLKGCFSEDLKNPCIFQGGSFRFSDCMAAREPVSWWLLLFTLLCSSHNWVTLVGCWSFVFLWRLIAFMPVVVEPWLWMITFSWIVCQGVEKKKECDVPFFLRFYDEKTLATSLFAKIGSINCCNLFVKSGKNARSIVDEILSSKQN